jgi:hypothetical protein
MTQYLITFPSDAMNHIPDDEMPEVGRAAHAVCQELIDAGVYLLTGDLEEEPANLVGTDGTVTEGRDPTSSAESRSWTCLHAKTR